ncbi:group I truncated hemoglobin [Paraburkholderia oxyphila]|uniref:group I truncated hemoglobin n=1 Tax=Paraburkholderia oxyphila TaxID=614212 RepID=UPI0005BA848B|nr:group 1 truncated hemoglobin [Paraburkholderia oxyphila]
MKNSVPTDTAQKGEAASKTLYERLGGAYGIATAVDRLIENLHRNETLNAANEKVKAFHTDAFKAGYKFMVTAWVIEFTGGPKCYPGRDMVTSHSHLGLTAYEFDVTTHEIKNTLYQLGAPSAEIEELMKIIYSQRDNIVTKAS